MTNENNQNIFHKEVLIRGATALLPTNLSDKWLDVLVQQALRLNDESETKICPELLAAILSILAAKFPTSALSLCQSKLFEYMHLYAIELYTEKFARMNNTLRSLVTLDSILTEDSFHRATTLAYTLGEPK